MRDNDTGIHILRTQHYVKVLAERLCHHPKFQDYLDADTISILHKSASLHDIGKVGVPDSILLKPGKLTPDELEVMKTHTVLGWKAIDRIESSFGSNSFLVCAKEIAISHHERWDGTGYPKGLKGDEIPISGRIMAVADVYDALISARCYKVAFSHEKAATILRDGAGSQHDPDVVQAFFDTENEFKSVAAQFASPNKSADTWVACDFDPHKDRTNLLPYTLPKYTRLPSRLSLSD